VKSEEFAAAVPKEKGRVKSEEFASALADRIMVESVICAVVRYQR